MNLFFDQADLSVPDVQGLTYVPDFIGVEEERALLSHIDAQPWLADLKRRVQHYGWRYDYRARGVTAGSYLGALPEWLLGVSQKLGQYGFARAADQAIVNEYVPGQGIAAHVDCVPCFGDVIASLSLQSGVMMRFTHAQTQERQELYLQPRSLLLLSGAARYDWQHEIPARQSDVVEGFRVQRQRRVSVTFRTVIID